jgi:hypothetical protein
MNRVYYASVSIISVAPDVWEGYVAIFIDRVLSRIEMTGIKRGDYWTAAKDSRALKRKMEGGK